MNAEALHGSPSQGPRRHWRQAAVAGLLACSFAGLSSAVSRGAATSPLAAAPVDTIDADPALRTRASAVAAPVYAAHCADCHGAQREGSQASGVPKLSGPNRLWGDATADSELQALEQTIRYGIRSGHPKTRHLSDMPAYAHDPALRLGPQQIDDLVDYTLSLTARSSDQPAVERGRVLFAGTANCFDCHSADGSGNRDWGVPDLTLRDPAAWLHGNSRAAIRHSIAEGPNGVCPAWATRLSDAEIKALAVWIGAGTGHP